MRVICTEIYFETPNIEEEVSPIAKSLSLAWFRGEAETYEKSDLLSLLRWELETYGRGLPATKRFVSECLRYGVEDQNYRDSAYYEFARHWVAGEEVMEAYETEVVIELSPPTTFPLSQLIAKAPGSYRYLYRIPDRNRKPAHNACFRAWWYSGGKFRDRNIEST